MRRLELSDDGEDELTEHEKTEDADEDGDVGEEDELTSEPGDADRNRDDTPLREVTPSEASVELDDDYVPLGSVRSRGNGRAKLPRKSAKSPASKSAKKASKVTRSKPVANKAPANKKLKLTRGAAGERRMSQNRS